MENVVADFKASNDCQDLIKQSIEEWKGGPNYAIMEITEFVTTRIFEFVENYVSWLIILLTVIILSSLTFLWDFPGFSLNNYNSFKKN